jgi:hypothetical protein
MLEPYGKGTHVPCLKCGRKIFITEAEVTTRDGRRWVKLTCKSAACVSCNKPRLYDEDTLEIHGTESGSRIEFVRGEGNYNSSWRTKTVRRDNGGGRA